MLFLKLCKCYFIILFWVLSLKFWEIKNLFIFLLGRQNSYQPIQSNDEVLVSNFHFNNQTLDTNYEDYENNQATSLLSSSSNNGINNAFNLEYSTSIINQNESYSDLHSMTILRRLKIIKVYYKFNKKLFFIF